MRLPLTQILLHRRTTGFGDADLVNISKNCLNGGGPFENLSCAPTSDASITWHFADEMPSNDTHVA